MTSQEERAARLKAVKNKSLRLMQMDANGTLDKIAEGKRGDINNSINSTDGLVQNNPMQKAPDPARKFNMNKVSVAAGNVPSVIRESFQNQPPVSEGVTTTSVLDDVFGLNDFQPSITQPIMEEVQRPQQQIQPVSAGIDYPMIRTIVEDIVRKYTSSLSKKMVNEGKGNEINTIALGERFKFLDNKGNIYECTMKKVGNINNKKGVNG